MRAALSSMGACCFRRGGELAGNVGDYDGRRRDLTAEAGGDPCRSREPPIVTVTVRKSAVLRCE